MGIEIELPDGTILEAPDGADPSTVAKAYLAKQRGAAAPATGGSPKSILSAQLGGAEAAGSLASGFVSQIPAGLAGLAGIMLPGPEGQGARWVEAVQNALTYRPRTAAGQSTLATIQKPLELLDRAASVTGEGDPNLAKPGAPPIVPYGESAIFDAGGFESMAHPTPLQSTVAKTGTLMLPSILGGPEALARRPAPLSMTPEAILARAAGKDSAGAAAAAQDITAVSPQLRTAVTTAGRKGGISTEALTRHVEAESLPVPIRLTEGEATQSPVQISFERNNRGAVTEAVERMDETNKRLGANLATVRDQIGSEVFSTNAVEHGDTLIRSYLTRDAEVTGEINSAYAAAREANGGELPMDGKGFVKAADAGLKKAMKGRYVPREIAADVAEIRDGGAMNFETFENLRTNLAAESRKAERAGDGNAVHAIRIVRDALENVEPVGRAKEVKPLFDTARNLARQRFAALDADPAYKAAVDGTTPPDQFVSKFVLRAPRDDVATLIKALGEDPAARQTVSVAVLDHLRDAARLDQNYGGNFSSAGFARALKALDPKANLVFDATTAETLEKLRNVANYTTAQPRGSFVNNSNTLVGGLSRRLVSKVPGGPLALEVIDSAGTGRRMRSALKPGAGIAQPKRDIME